MYVIKFVSDLRQAFYCKEKPEDATVLNRKRTMQWKKKRVKKQTIYKTLHIYPNLERRRTPKLPIH
jgi:hypothetical protein